MATTIHTRNVQHGTASDSVNLFNTTTAAVTMCTGAGSVVVADTLTLASASITSSTNAISFAGDALSTTGAVQGGSITDGTATLATGSITGGVASTFSGAVTGGSITGGSITDGLATLSSGALSGATTLTASGIIEGGSITDGTATLMGGILSGVGTLNVTGISGDGITLKPFGTSNGNTSEIRFKELVAGGSNYVGFKAADALSGNIIWTLPSIPGTNGQVLTTNGSDALEFTTAAGGGASVLSGLTDITQDATNFVDSFLIQTNSDGGAPTTGTLLNASNNLGIGNSVFSVLTSGTLNTCLGHNAGSTATEGSENTCIGASTGLSALAENQTALGFEATCNAENQITLGNSSVNALRCADTTIASLSDERDKTDIVDSSYGLDFVSTLRPVQFKWDRRNLVAGDETSAHNGKTRVGFIAQELQSAMPNNENDILDLVYDVNPERIEAKYGNLIPILTKAIQDLSAANDALVARVAALESA